MSKNIWLTMRRARNSKMLNVRFLMEAIQCEALWKTMGLIPPKGRP